MKTDVLVQTHRHTDTDTHTHTHTHTVPGCEEGISRAGRQRGGLEGGQAYQTLEHKVLGGKGGHWTRGLGRVVRVGRVLRGWCRVWARGLGRGVCVGRDRILHHHVLLHAGPGRAGSPLRLLQSEHHANLVVIKFVILKKLITGVFQIFFASKNV